MDMATESFFYKIFNHLFWWPNNNYLLSCSIMTQILDMKSFLESGSVLGMDKTYNLCPYFLSTFTYHNLKVVKKETKKNHVLISPMMLHCNSSFETYNIFCSIVRGALEGSERNASISFLIGDKIVVGCDEEKAITKALAVAFPISPRFLCTRHLKQNVIKHLENKVGATIKSPTKQDCSWSIWRRRNRQCWYNIWFRRKSEQFDMHRDVPRATRLPRLLRK